MAIAWSFDNDRTFPLYYVVELKSVGDSAIITRQVQFSKGTIKYGLRFDNLLSNTDYIVDVTSVGEFGNSPALRFTLRTKNCKSYFIDAGFTR